MDRLLPPEELTKINDAMPSEAKYGDVFLVIRDAQDARTRSATLKEVQSLWGEFSNSEDWDMVSDIWKARFYQLLHEEMPK